MTTTIYGTDSLTIQVTLTENSEAFDLTGCTIEAAAMKVAGTAVAATTAITNAAGGIFTITFAAGTFLGAAGTYTLQCRVTQGAEVQTVLVTTFVVVTSIVAA